MNFKKIDTTDTNPQKRRIFDSKEYDLDCVLTLNSSKVVEKIELNQTPDQSNNYGLKSVLFCDKLIDGNQTVKIIVVNMQYNNNNYKLEIEFGDNYYKDKVDIQTGDLIFVWINEFSDDRQEKTDCSDIDVDDFKPNPKTKNGSILVGKP